MILMDIRMPVMDGIEATKTIRAGELSTGKHIPIIAFTADDLQKDQQYFLENGMDDYIQKPVTKKALSKIFEKFHLSGKVPVGIDIDKLKTQTGDDDEFLKEILQKFVKSVASKIDAIEKAIELKDTAQIQSLAHSLKGTSASMYAKPLANTSAKMQKGNLSDAIILIDELKEQYQITIKQIKKYL